MRKLQSVLLPVLIFGLIIMPVKLSAWDHPGHMITAAIAFLDIESRSEFVEKTEIIKRLEILLMKHPDTGPFWVAAGDAQGTERARRMFIEAARWPDDVKGGLNDRPAWHSARWAFIVEDGLTEEELQAVRKAAEPQQNWPAGQAIESLRMSYAELSSPETSIGERARALCWVMHIMGDIHQPLHVCDKFSKEFPTGNAAGTQEWVMDPINKKPIPLHLLWDSPLCCCMQ